MKIEKNSDLVFEVTLPERLMARDPVVALYRNEVLEKIKELHPEVVSIDGPSKITNRNRLHLTSVYVASSATEDADKVEVKTKTPRRRTTRSKKKVENS